MSLGKTLAVKSLLVISIPLCFQILIVFALGHLQSQAQLHMQAVQTSLTLSRALSGLVRDLTEARVKAMEYGARYLFSSGLLATHAHAIEQIEIVKRLLKDDAQKAGIVAIIEEHTRKAPEIITTMTTPDGNHPLEILVRQLTIDSSTIAGLVRDEERKTTAAMDALKRSDTQYQTILTAGTAIEILLLVMAFLWLRKDIVNRLAVMKSNSLLITMKKPLKPLLGGDDELSQLDVVFHKMSEELAEATQLENILVENLRAVVCSLDTRLTFKECNYAVALVFGYAPEDLIGARIASFLPPSELEKATAVFESARAGAQAALETPVLRKDGTLLDTLWSVRWSDSDKSYFCVIQDNTSRKEADRQREALLNMVAIDLRQPLEQVNHTISSLQQERYGSLTERGHKLVSTAGTATWQMLSITNDMLDLNQLESGTLKVSLERISISSLFAQAQDATTGLAQSFGIGMETRPIDLYINVDRSRMLQIMSNLVSNAVKFSPKGATVTIEAVRDGDHVEIRVIDRGRGIPSGAIGGIFERFRQVQESDATEMKGSGLGLAITKELVNLLGGTISVTSTAGKGSTFSVRLPVAGEGAASEVKQPR